MIKEKTKFGQNLFRSCPLCGGRMIDAGMYDPEGVIPLYGGKKIFGESGILLKWYICLNPSCEDGVKNRLHA